MTLLRLRTPLALALLVGLLLGMGLVRETLLFRWNFDPDYPRDLTDFVTARGFPFAWLVVGPAELLPTEPLWRRFLAGRFVTSGILLLPVAAGLLWVARRVRRTPGSDPRMGQP